MGQFSQVNLNRIAFTNKRLSNCIAQQSSLLQGLTKNSVLQNHCQKKANKEYVFPEIQGNGVCLKTPGTELLTELLIHIHSSYIKLISS